MKRSITALPLLVLVFLSVSCSKSGNNANNDVQKKKAEDLAAYLLNKNFQPTAFYSDHPIDFDQSDNVVKQETDLWGYVRPYIKDDLNSFEANGVLVVNQGALTIAGSDSAQLHRIYSISYDNNNVYLHFVDYNYEPLQYTLSQFDDTGLVLYVTWDLDPAVKLYSRFERKQ